MVRALALVVLALLAAGSVARADYVPVPELIALLPLDADKKLEIYGQPVANEVAKVLRGAGLTVTVVGARMGVPTETKLIIDGTIAAEKSDKKGQAIVLTLRIRNPADGATLNMVSATATSVTTMDTVVPEISARLLPAVREKLAMLAKPPGPAPDPGPGTTPTLVVTAAAPKRRLLTAMEPGGGEAEALGGALASALTTLAAHADRVPMPVAASLMARESAARTVKDKRTDLGILVAPLRYVASTCRGIPCARARVRVRVADAVGVLFDRVVITDTVIGDKGIASAALAARVAAEVFAILRPNLERVVPGWH